MRERGKREREGERKREGERDGERERERWRKREPVALVCKLNRTRIIRADFFLPVSKEKKYISLVYLELKYFYNF